MNGLECWPRWVRGPDFNSFGVWEFARLDGEDVLYTAMSLAIALEPLNSALKAR